MSRYATAADLALYGISEEAFSGVPSDDVQARLDAASSTADSYLNSRFTLPLVAPYPDALKDAVSRIAAYNLLSVRGYNPQGEAEQVRLRYEDAIRWLEGVAGGRVSPAGIADSSGSASAGSGVPFVVAPRYESADSFTSGPPVPRGWR